ncbi:MAG: phospho-N-acetylmuramoyl-pentapeptide-transferase [Bacillota bacterium]
MIYLLIRDWLDWLDDRGFGFLRVFTYATFRATIAIVLSFVICVLLGPPVIRWLRKQKIADLAGFDQAEIDALMASKKGTPTMGGLVIITAVGVTTLLLGDLSRETGFYVHMALICMTWLAVVGATDDWLKLTAGRRAGSRQGLYSWEKLAFQIGLAVLLMFFTYRHGGQIAATHTLYFPFFKNLQVELSIIPFVIFGTLVLTGSSNAVNLTDGLDGLAGGCMGIVSFTFFILALIVGTSFAGREVATYLYLPHIRTSDELAVIAGAMAGACMGFLWYNCNPAAVFMGDTGSLALGGLIGYIAIVIRQELVLFIVGGIFVVEALSVLIQVGYFKYTKHRYGEGRRIFLMAPLHHHFQRKGWTETQVVVRFWLITAMLSALALATVKLR